MWLVEQRHQALARQRCGRLNDSCFRYYRYCGDGVGYENSQFVLSKARFESPCAIRSWGSPIEKIFIPGITYPAETHSGGQAIFGRSYIRCTAPSAMTSTYIRNIVPPTVSSQSFFFRSSTMSAAVRQFWISARVTTMILIFFKASAIRTAS